MPVTQLFGVLAAAYHSPEVTSSSALITTETYLE